MGDKLAQLHRKIADCVCKEELVALLGALIRQQSDTHGTQEYGMALELQRYAAANGLHCQLQPVDGERSNVLIRFPGQPGGKTLLYSGHIDVVPAGNPEQWDSPPYEPTLRNGRLYGRGASDMKGSIAAALYAVAVLKKAGIALKGDVLFALDIDEETQNRGMKAFLESGLLHADACIVGEPSDLKINIGHKGVIGFWLTFRGKRAHASVPQRGINPIAHCATLIQRIERFQREVLDARLHPVLGSPTLTVTMLQSGKELNSIPEQADMRLDRRYLKSESPEACRQEIEALLTDMRQEDAGVDVTLRITTVCPPGEISSDDPFVQTIRRALCPENPHQAVVKPFLASCEMDMVMENLRIPTLIFGPGRLEEAHTVNEFIDLEQLKKGAELFARIFIEYLGVQEQ